MKLLLSLMLLGLFYGQTQANADWDWDTLTFLDNFVSRIDPEFDPTVPEILYYNNSAIGCDTYILNFTSGRWLDESFSSQPLWWHYLAINIPVAPEATLNFNDAGFLFIDGGGNGGPPGPDDEFIVGLCIMTKDTGSVSAVLKQIPNQDIVFADDPFQEGRGEDDLIAYTWRKFIETHEDVADYEEADYEQIAQFPMARAGVRALDVMREFVGRKVPGTNLQRFAVSGGSKRGWAAWLVALLDQRVEMTAPLVITILNVTQNLHHHYENLGAWTFAFGDYWLKNITVYIDDPRTQLVFDQIDPYCYRRRLTCLKMIGAGTGDEFFSPDASYDFYEALPEPKYMFMLENAEHALVGSYTRIIKNMGTLWYCHLINFPIPQMTWTMTADATGGELIVTTDTIPTLYQAFHGDSVPDTRRDFRIIALDGLQYVYWNATDDAQWTIIDDFNYIVRYDNSVDTPYRGFLVNMFFPGPEPLMPLEFTTEANIIPQNRPFPPCVGAECQGSLI